MTYAIEGLGIIVMAACVIAIWRSTFEAKSRQPHLLTLFTGHLLSTWAVLAALLLGEESERPWWQAMVIVSLLLSAYGLARLTWFMWLRNGHLRED